MAGAGRRPEAWPHPQALSRRTHSCPAGEERWFEQFQTTGFSARLWELYLFATFREMGYRIDRLHAVPDFTCVGLPGEFCVEAVTINPTRAPSGAVVPPPGRDAPEAMRIFQKEYMPIRYGSALTSKLAKRYWDRANVAGKPLIFAIHDFHAPMSMVGSRSGLAIYLYGFYLVWGLVYVYRSQSCCVTSIE